MKKYNLKSEDDLFQIEVDALEAIRPEEFKEMVLACVDEFFDQKIYQKNLKDRKITPTEDDLETLAIDKTRDLLVYLQSEEEEK
jgi:hypothetical protein